MRNVLYSSEIIDTIKTKLGPAEVRVIMDAQYDEEKGMLHGKLESFLCSPGTEKRLPRIPEFPLPDPQVITERVGFSEAMDLAKEIFQRAVKKTREIAWPTFK